MENERFRGLALLPAAGLVVVMGCTAGGAEMAIDELHEFGSGYTAAWNSRNLASVAALYREDGSLQVNDPEPSVGPEAIA